MKVLVVVSVLAMVGAGPAPALLHTYRYHELVGIPRATAIKEAEESGVAASSRILNGAPAVLGQFPFFGGLLIHLESGHTSSCGSALITSTKLVTAAHCWTDGGSPAVGFTVVLGSVWLFTGGLRIFTADVTLHEGWMAQGWDLKHDIAIVTTPPVTFTDVIQPIALASGSNDFAGQTAQAIGMGMTSNTAPVGPHTFLAWVSLPVISNSQCSTVYPGFVDENILCTASVDGSNTCTGDSGGPIVVGNTLVGVVSFGSGGGCEALLPAGHSRVSAYYDWITAQL